MKKSNGTEEFWSGYGKLRIQHSNRDINSMNLQVIQVLRRYTSGQREYRVQTGSQKTPSAFEKPQGQLGYSQSVSKQKGKWQKSHKTQTDARLTWVHSFKKNFFYYFNWKIIALHYCTGFYHTSAKVGRSIHMSPPTSSHLLLTPFPPASHLLPPHPSSLSRTLS